MRRIVPLWMIVFFTTVAAQAQQPPTLDPDYERYINTGQGYWITIGTEVSGSQPISYEWTKDGNVISDDDSHYYLNIESVTPEDAGTYVLTATNAYGSATSDPIVIEVKPNVAPVAEISWPRPGVTFTPGEELSFSGRGSDEEPWHNPSHTWMAEYHNGVEVAPGPPPSEVAWSSESTTDGYFVIPPDLVPDAASFYRIFLTVRDYHGLTHTDSVDVGWSGRLNTMPPEIEVQPADVTASAGSAASFTVVAKLATSYQWKLDGEPIAGATDATYEIQSIETKDFGTYQVIVSNASGSVESDEAELRLTAGPPVFQQQPANETVTEGASVDFTASAAGATSYQWQFNGANIQGATNDTLVINPVRLSHRGSYSVIASNAFGSTASNLVTLTVIDVNPPPTSVVTIKTNPANLSVVVNGKVVPTRYAQEMEIGTELTAGPVTPQTIGGVTYAFSNWGHGGEPTQTITAGDRNSWHTINYSSPLAGRWRTTDVGAVNIYGSASVSNGTYTLGGSGNDIWGTADAFRFVYQTVYGDVDIRARVTSIDNTDTWAKAGVMIRSSTDRSAKHAMSILRPEGGASFQWRMEPRGVSSATNEPAAVPYWVRMVRVENTFTSYISSDGSSWTMIGAPLTLPMSEMVYAGLVVTSHSTNVLCEATMTDVLVTTPTMATAFEVSGVMDEQDPSFEVYPNPLTGDKLRIRVGGEVGASEVQVVNVLGQIFYNHDATGLSDANGVEIDVSDLPRGVYIVRILRQSGFRTRSFIRN